MNRIFHTIWNEVTQSYVAASEASRSRRKRNSSSGSGAVAAPTVRPMALEQRFMFDGAALSAVVDAVDHTVTDAAKAVEVSTAQLAAAASAPEVATEKDRIDTPHAWLSSNDTADVRQIVVVDGTVVDYQTLIAGIDPSLPVIILEPNASGLGEIEMMAQVLSRYQNLDAIHLVTEGRTGAILLGGEALWSGDLDAASPYLKSIGNALKPGGDLMLYGCSVAGNAEGQKFIDDLAKAVGGEVDIAASDDRTGPTALGGDWDLEYQTGNVETVLPFTLQGMQDIGHCLGCTYDANNLWAPDGHLIAYYNATDLLWYSGPQGFNYVGGGFQQANWGISPLGSVQYVMSWAAECAAPAGPAFSSATYDASTSVLTVTATGMTVGDSIDETKLTLTGQGGGTYAHFMTHIFSPRAAVKFQF